MLVPVLLVALACTSLDVSVTPEDTLGLTDEEVAMLLDFLNDCGTTFELLDEDVALDSDAARSLVDHRDGPDGRCGTADDDPFDSVTEVDEVPNVGEATIRQIVAWLEGPPPDGGGTWDGVDFTEEEVEVVLEIANEATEEELTEGVGLDDYRAGIILDNRPYADMDELAETPGIGQATLQALKDYVDDWEATHG